MPQPFPNQDEWRAPIGGWGAQPQPAPWQGPMPGQPAPGGDFGPGGPGMQTGADIVPGQGNLPPFVQQVFGGQGGFQKAMMNNPFIRMMMQRRGMGQRPAGGGMGGFPGGPGQGGGMGPGQGGGDPMQLLMQMFGGGGGGQQQPWGG